MKTHWILATLLVGSLTGGCESPDAANTRAYGSPGQPALAGATEDGDEDLDLADIPSAVRAAALAALPGLVITHAERETEDGVVQYSLEGKVNGIAKEVEVSPDGQKVKVQDDDDDGDDADDDDDDDDDDDGDDN